MKKKTAIDLAKKFVFGKEPPDTRVIDKKLSKHGIDIYTIYEDFTSQLTYRIEKLYERNTNADN